MRNLSRAILVAAFILLASRFSASAADLAYSTYLRDGFTPTAMTSDAQGNLYIAGSAVTDPISRTTSAVVAKLDPKASRYLYLEYLDSAASDTISGLAIDSAGNLLVTGTTSNPYFPVTGNALGSAPSGANDTRAFVTRLSPNGVVLLSVLIGGSATSNGYGIAVTSQGQILVSGVSGANFAATDGAFHVSDTTGKWFLVELDAAASKVVFSATGIGGSSIALDAAGNIFLAGSSLRTDYPTTPGAYQTSFVPGFYCFGFCRFEFPGKLLHLTKLDPSGSKLIFSTGINDPSGGAGSTISTGLAVDAAGNSYVTGTLLEGKFPFTVGNPIGAASGFLVKVNPAGSSLLFSVPVGGGGVVRDSAGFLYTAGTISTYNPIGFPGIIPTPVITLSGALSTIPPQCVPNTLTGTESSYLMQLDSATGAVLDAQWIDGSSVTVSAVVTAGTKLWAAGLSLAADVPFTPGALAPTNLIPGPLPGAFLSAADFSRPPANGAPMIACALDAGNLTHAGPVAPYQILSIFGSNLGPATGVPAPDLNTTSLAGVSVNFDGIPATLTYVSSSQINVMVPGPPATSANKFPDSIVMQVTTNSGSLQREFGWTNYNLNLFAEIGAIGATCPGYSVALDFQPVALNPDGTRNSCSNPAKFGSLVSLFVHGVGAQQLGLAMPGFVNGVQAQAGSCPANIENVVRSGIVYRVDVRLPATLVPCAPFNGNAINPVILTLRYNGAPVGPLIINKNPTPATPVQSHVMRVWATQ